ncbi:hypothetical protein [Gluconacetobacter tumulicola]|uniref:Uncharacterized protein n=1 Tax=Gluconacetobacter tumulicola TaxID=1017177 RepID=A0A7W4JF53_9PROT|nr:hypothetical protein [Gluconacetobacter tumulicola]MBB2180130.1 hypothetical protein [Gluconacetobacter tumulicola]
MSRKLINPGKGPLSRAEIQKRYRERQKLAECTGENLDSMLRSIRRTLARVEDIQRRIQEANP